MSVNLVAVDVARDEGDPPGYDTGYARIGPEVGATSLGMSVYELPPDQSICPYHWEAGDEEWLVVLTGRPTLRTPEGEHELAPWDAVCFPEGPDGAHKVTNRTEQTLRVAILSTKREPGVSVYPDSNKVGVWPPGKLFRLEDAVDYWDGES
ncbi:MAG: cupin domain-containing protein [Gaiellaceae bacterium]